MRFYLGTHMENWLAKTEVPLFVSHRRLLRRKTLPLAAGRWALDSGGFTELNLHGEWRTTEPEYVAAVRRYRDEVGQLDWAAPMDWMCEPVVLERTGLTVDEHIRRTIRNYLRLREELGELVIPVLQGWGLDDYLRCLEGYQAVGVELAELPTVGLGTVCRRQHMAEAALIVRRLHDEGISLHGFGVKTLGLKAFDDALVSADSMAWSYDARRAPALPGHTHLNCANCLPYALRWHDELLVGLGQLRLEVPA